MLLPVVQTKKNTRGVSDQRLLDLTLLDNNDRNFAKRRRCLSVISFLVISADKHCIQFCHFNICNRFQEQVPDVRMDLAIWTFLKPLSIDFTSPRVKKNVSLDIKTLMQIKFEPSKKRPAKTGKYRRAEIFITSISRV